MINNNLRDYLVKSKYSKMLQTARYQQNFLSSKGSGFNPQTFPGCATLSKAITEVFFMHSVEGIFNEGIVLQSPKYFWFPMFA